MVVWSAAVGRSKLLRNRVLIEVASILPLITGSEFAPRTHQDLPPDDVRSGSPPPSGGPENRWCPAVSTRMAESTADRLMALAMRLASPAPGWLTTEASSLKTAGEGNGQSVTWLFQPYFELVALHRNLQANARVTSKSIWFLREFLWR